MGSTRRSGPGVKSSGRNPPRGRLRDPGAGNITGEGLRRAAIRAVRSQDVLARLAHPDETFRLRDGEDGCHEVLVRSAGNVERKLVQASVAAHVDPAHPFE